MRHHRPSLVAFSLLLAAACASGGVVAPTIPTPTAPAAPPPPRTASPAGFDAYYYPGDAAMRTWRTASPYTWVGYYLPAPCHRETSWRGRRATLAAMGWEVAVLFVGQQTWEGQAQVVAPADSARPAAVRDSTATDTVAAARPPAAATDPLRPSPAIAAAPACAPSQLTPERGAADAAVAIAEAAGDGFPQGTTIYLDVERMDAIPAAMRDYYRAWTRAVAADGRFRVGVYAHTRNAAEIRRDVEAELRAAGVTGAAAVPRFWIASTAGFEVGTATPAGSGHAFATVWQGRLDVRETWGGVTLPIDVNVSAVASPSAP